jgi:hypothetical protein
MTVGCSTCDEEIEPNDEIICGGSCGKRFHFDRCAKLNKWTFKATKEKRNIKWFCMDCDAVIDVVLVKLNYITGLLNRHDDRFDKVETSMDEIKHVVSELTNKVKNSNANRNEKKEPSYADILKT